MNYSTLKEAYDEDTFEKEKKHKKKKAKCEETIDKVEEQAQVSNQSSTSIQSVQVPIQTGPLHASPAVADNKQTIQPYFDEELNRYLNITEFQSAAPVPSQNTNILSQNNNVPSQNNNVPSQKTASKTAQYVTPICNNTSGKTANMTKRDLFYKNMINIALFIFIGIIIIFICDQITEIAINIGMKRAINILEPYLQNIQSI